MPARRTAASKYPSRYGKSRWVTAAQYLAEVMCERRARAEKKTLPPEFWKDEHWGNLYRQQVAAASRLIKRLDPEGTGSGAAAVSAFLKTERGKTCYSLMGAWVVPLVEVAHRAVVLRREAAPPVQEEAPREEVGQGGPREAFVAKKSILSKLEGL